MKGQSCSHPTELDTAYGKHNFQKFRPLRVLPWNVENATVYKLYCKKYGNTYGSLRGKTKLS